MARPSSAPYLIRREAYARILKAFAEHGIKFAHRQVTVFVPGGSAPGAAPGTGLSAAAAARAGATAALEPPAADPAR